MNDNKLSQASRETLISMIRSISIMDVLTTPSGIANGINEIAPFLPFRSGNDQTDEEIILAITRIQFAHIKGEAEGAALADVARLLRGPNAA
jgi:hypothetical protein